MIENPPGPKSEHVPDPYADWTDEQRATEFAQTGDPSCLTPELALHMQVTPETMAKVPGATQTNIEEAVAFSNNGGYIIDEFSDAYEIFMDAISEEELNKLPELPMVFRRLLDAAAIPVEDWLEIDTVEDRRAIVDTAIQKIEQLLYNHTGAVYALFHSMEHFQAEGIRDVETMHEVYRRIYRTFIALSHMADISEEQKQIGQSAAQALNEFVVVGKEILSATHLPANANYLTAKYLESFAYSLGITEDGHIDRDNFLPFEIEGGRLAVFSSDGLRLYVLDTEYSAEIQAEVSALKSKVTYHEQGQYFARHTEVSVPERLWELIDEMVDNAIPLDSVSGITDRETLRDYISLLRSETRAVVESEFGFELKDLTIREQFYFLTYLKHTTVETAETMQEFTHNYGVAGMRAFLTNAYDDKASENIMAFGIVTEPDVAGDAFMAYAKTLDSTRQFVDSFSGHAHELMQEVQEGMLRRAGHLFTAGKQLALWEYPGEESMGDLVEAFKGLAKMQSILARLGTDQSLKFVAHENSQQNIKNTGAHTFQFDLTDTTSDERLKLKVTVRPTATKQGEARINFELDLSDLPDSNPTKKAFLHQMPNRRPQSVIRLAFDLDTKTTPPRFSFDTGRNTYKGTTFVRTGDVLGNILDKVAPEGHHLTDFDPKFSDPEVFAEVAQAFIRHFTELTDSSAQ